MHRFFSPQSDFSQQSIKITDTAELHHLAHVLRLKKGQTVAVFNNTGQEITGTIQRLTPHAAEINILTRRKKEPKPGPHLILACAIPKKAKFETIIEKCTELGVNEIVPLLTQRSEVRPDSVRQKNKNQRYQSVAVNAAKQSGRPTLPVIQPLRKFKQFIRDIPAHSLALIPCLKAQQAVLPKIMTAGRGIKNIVVLIGPEGDFSDLEVALAVEQGCVPVSLGSNVLKVDTAAISLTALIHYLAPSLPIRAAARSDGSRKD